MVYTKERRMLTTTVFKNGRSQAVRLPKEFRFKSKKVGVARIGNAVILYPADQAWQMMQHALDHFTADFMADRDQPQKTDRRPGL